MCTLSCLMRHTAQPTPTCSKTCHGAPTPPLGSVLRCTSSLTCPNWACSPTQLRAVPSFLTWLCAALTQSPGCWVTLNPPHLPSLRAVLLLGASPVVHPGLSKGSWGRGRVQVEGWRCQVGSRGDEGLVHLVWGRVVEAVGDERRGTCIDEPKCTCLESCALGFTRSNLVVQSSRIHMFTRSRPTHLSSLTTVPLPIVHKP